MQGFIVFRKLAGEGPVKYPPRVNERTSCVGMCHRDRVKGEKVSLFLSCTDPNLLGLRTKTMSALRKKRAKGKPCVGLCYITKLEKMEKRHQRRTKIRRKMMDKMSNQ